MKNITFFTTFHQNGYELYGKSWIDSFIQNVSIHGTHIKAKIYVQNVNSELITHPQIEYIDFNKSIPEHEEWKQSFIKLSTHNDYVKKNSIRFSHKGFVISHALDTIQDGYAVWLDGDCVMHKSTYDDFPQSLLKDVCMACQVEETGGDNHVESGILLFDMENKDIQKFKQTFKQNYDLPNALNMTQPFDGFIIYKSIHLSQITINNLNDSFGIPGIQSCPTFTFLNPEINTRFTHNIGVEGKSRYTEWHNLKTKDEIFNILNQVNGFFKNQVKINNLRDKRRRLKSNEN